MTHIYKQRAVLKTFTKYRHADTHQHKNVVLRVEEKIWFQLYIQQVISNFTMMTLKMRLSKGKSA
jgi:hypothetical protein